MNNNRRRAIFASLHNRVKRVSDYAVNHPIQSGIAAGGAALLAHREIINPILIKRVFERGYSASDAAKVAKKARKLYPKLKSIRIKGGPLGVNNAAFIDENT